MTVQLFMVPERLSQIFTEDDKTHNKLETNIHQAYKDKGRRLCVLAKKT